MPSAMTLVDQLLAVATEYARARNLSLARVSTLVFNDGKVFDRLSDGKDLTTGRYETSLRWLSANWPEGAQWPVNVDRPVAEASAA